MPVHATTRVLTDNGVELVFCVNHLSSYLLTRILLERMKESAPSRILLVNSHGPLYRWYSRHPIWRFLKNPQLSGEAIYYLAAAPELAGTSGGYLSQTIDEKPAGHALDRALGGKVWDLSGRLTGGVL